MLSLGIYGTVLALLVYIAFLAALYLKSRSMRKKEKLLVENGVTPYGSGLCHGMVLDRKSKRRVKHDEKPSDSWYSRLA